MQWIRLSRTPVVFPPVVVTPVVDQKHTLRKAEKINKTRIYKDTVYINTNKEDLKSIISIKNINQ